MSRATTLDQAYKLLDPRPLASPLDEAARGAKGPNDPDFYIEPPPLKKNNRNLPSPVENIRQRLLTGGHDTKMFLCGHVGSGKSTELNRLASLRIVFTLDVLDAELMRYALAFVHRAHALRMHEDRRYLDRSRVLECNDGAVWFEAVPLLWQPLGQRMALASQG